jgi:hypothetical protein
MCKFIVEPSYSPRSALTRHPRSLPILLFLLVISIAGYRAINCRVQGAVGFSTKKFISPVQLANNYFLYSFRDATTAVPSESLSL